MGIQAIVITQPGGPHLDAYLSGLAASSEVNGVCVADAGGASFGAAQKALGSKLTGTGTDASALMREHRPRFAIVSMEAVLSPTAIEVALEYGCHVLCEKPACVRAADFERLLYFAEARHLHLMLAFANRIRPEALEARRVVREGWLGKIYGMEVHLVADQTRLRNLSYRSSWLGQRARAGGGHLTWLGIHWLDLALFVSGVHIDAVAGFSMNVGGQGLEIDDANAAALKFVGGGVGTLTSGYYLDRGYHQHLKIWGEHGWLEMNHQPETVLRWASRTEPRVEGIQTYVPPKDPVGYTPWVHACAQAASGLLEPPVTGREGLHVLEAIYAFYDAAAEGKVRSLKRR